MVMVHVGPSEVGGGGGGGAMGAIISPPPPLGSENLSFFLSLFSLSTKELHAPFGSKDFFSSSSSFFFCLSAEEKVPALGSGDLFCFAFHTSFPKIFVQAWL